MHKPISKSFELLRHTGDPIFTMKAISLFGIIPILSRICCKKYFRDLLVKLSNKRGKDTLFTTKFGTFVAKTLNGRSVITQEYEPLVRKVMLENYKKNKDKERTFINIWSHIWRWLIEFVKVYGYTGIAFEPSKETFKYLRVNTILSNIEDKTKLFNFWLSNEAWKKKFKYIQHHDWHSHIINENESQEETITIETKIFDEVDLGIKIETIKLIMIDVEWHEYEVLQWMKNTLKEIRDVDMIVEIFDEDPNKWKVLELMKEVWFTQKRIDHADYLFHKE